MKITSFFPSRNQVQVGASGVLPSIAPRRAAPYLHTVAPLRDGMTYFLTVFPTHMLAQQGRRRSRPMDLFDAIAAHYAVKCARNISRFAANSAASSTTQANKRKIRSSLDFPLLLPWCDFPKRFDGVYHFLLRISRLHTQRIRSKQRLRTLAPTGPTRCRSRPQMFGVSQQ